ncbi:MAG: hypothetical protein RIQ81_1749 [Pseudomonadota bacterium]|jgi:molecular chaperone GrpE
MDTRQNGEPEENKGAGQADPATAGDQGALTAEIDKLREEVKSLQDRYLRQVAELENYRRRTEREKSDLLKFGNEGLVKDLVPVLDSFHQAMPAGGSEEARSTASVEGLISGMDMVRQQLMSALRRHGLEEVPAVGSKFDPNVHQAIQRIESDDCGVETVAQEFARGYLLNGRLVRPAMVSVTVPRG